MGINRRTRYVNFLSVMTLIALLSALFLSNRGIGLYQLQMPEQLIGIILVGAGSLMVIENAFTTDMDMRESDDIQFLVGVPGSLIAVLLGVGFLTLNPLLVSLFTGFEGGIYLTALVIIAAERITNMSEWNPRLSDFRS